MLFLKELFHFKFFLSLQMEVILQTLSITMLHDRSHVDGSE